jgi:hypothetical protein
MRLDESMDEDVRLVDAVANARALLEPPVRRDSVWPTFAAAVFFAVSALTFATAAILAPPAQLTPPAAEVRGAL